MRVAAIQDERKPSVCRRRATGSFRRACWPPGTRLDAGMNDVACMERALTLAARGLYTTLPNPRVGCVIVKDGEIVGEGWHEYAGGKHAEVVALAQAGRRAHGADVYVTLEPCNHWGRTPPCCEALVRAKVARVFVATPDPVAHTNQQGTEALRQHGIQVFHGLLAAQARALNPGFFTRVAKQRPWIRIKSAITMDGRTAFEADAGCWISRRRIASRCTVLARAQRCATDRVWHCTHRTIRA